MADNKVTITYGTEYDGKGAKTAQADLKKTEDQAQKTGQAAAQAGEQGATGFNNMAVGIGKAVAAFAAIKGVIDFFASSVQAANENARAVNTLAAAYNAVGYTAQGAMQQAQQFASKMQSLTGIADEAFLNAQRLLANYGVVGSKAQEAIQAAYALSIGRSIDFGTAMDIVSKAAAGQTQTLARYGIQIDKNTESGEKFDAVLAQINERFGATAQAAMGDSNTKLNALKESWGDFKEQVGKGLNDGLVPAVDFLTKAVGWLNQAFKSLGAIFGIVFDQAMIGVKQFEVGLVTAGEYALQAFEPLVSLMSYLPGIGNTIKEAYDGAVESLQQTGSSLQAQIEALEEMRTPLSAIWETEKAITEEQQARLELQAEEINNRVANEQAAQSQLTEAVLQGEEERAQIKEEYRQREQQGEEQNSQQNVKNDKKQAKDRQQIYSSMWGSLSSMASSENKKVSAAGKIAGVAQATVSTFTGAAKALELPFPANLAAMAAVLAQGFALVGQIQSIKMAEGGLVKAVTGGVPAIIGEGGSDEAVLPLDDSQAMRRIGGAIAEESGSVGGVIVNINVAASGGVEAILEQLTDASRNGVVQALEFANLNYKVGAEQQGYSV